MQSQPGKWLNIFSQFSLEYKRFEDKAHKRNIMAGIRLNIPTEEMGHNRLDMKVSKRSA